MELLDLGEKWQLLVRLPLAVGRHHLDGAIELHVLVVGLNEL